jgi:hypothetical protein
VDKGLTCTAESLAPLRGSTSLPAHFTAGVDISLPELCEAGPLPSSIILFPFIVQRAVSLSLYCSTTCLKSNDSVALSPTYSDFTCFKTKSVAEEHVGKSLITTDYESMARVLNPPRYLSVARFNHLSDHRGSVRQPYLIAERRTFTIWASTRLSAGGLATTSPHHQDCPTIRNGFGSQTCLIMLADFDEAVAWHFPHIEALGIISRYLYSTSSTICAT